MRLWETKQKLFLQFRKLSTWNPLTQNLGMNLQDSVEVDSVAYAFMVHVDLKAPVEV